MKTIVTALGALAFAAAPTSAQTDVSGAWQLTFETPRGEMTQVLTLQQDGMIITGTVEMRNGGQRRGGGGRSIEIADGSIEDVTVSFSIVRAAGDRVFETSFRGTLEGNHTITGTAVSPRREMPFTMTRMET